MKSNKTHNKALQPIANAPAEFRRYVSELPMEFSDKELAVIASAKKKVKTATFLRIVLVIAMLPGIGLMFTGVAVAEQIVYLAVAAIVLATVLPQFGTGPRYEELLKILESKANAQRSKT